MKRKRNKEDSHEKLSKKPKEENCTPDGNSMLISREEFSEIKNFFSVMSKEIKSLRNMVLTVTRKCEQISKEVNEVHKQNQLIGNSVEDLKEESCGLSVYEADLEDYGLSGSHDDSSDSSDSEMF